MRYSVTTALVSVIALGSVAFAQHQHAAPYAGMQERPIKALSDQQLADLRAGRGGGLALAAELNGYPGPVHILELADQLNLSPEMKRRMQGRLRRRKADYERART
jgi:hypothetical protein